MTTTMDDFQKLDYEEPFTCPHHNRITENGWCWECAVETYGYDRAKKVYNCWLGNYNVQTP